MVLSGSRGVCGLKPQANRTLFESLTSALRDQGQSFAFRLISKRLRNYRFSAGSILLYIELYIAGSPRADSYTAASQRRHERKRGLVIRGCKGFKIGGGYWWSRVGSNPWPPHCESDYRQNATLRLPLSIRVGNSQTSRSVCMQTCSAARAHCLRSAECSPRARNIRMAHNGSFGHRNLKRTETRNSHLLTCVEFCEELRKFDSKLECSFTLAPSVYREEKAQGCRCILSSGTQIFDVT